MKPKIKYKFDKSSLTYVKVDSTLKKKAIKLSTYILASLVVAIFYHILFNVFFDSPKVNGLKRENNQLVRQYAKLNDQLELVDQVLKDLQEKDDNIYRTIFEAEPIHNSIRKAGVGGVNRYAELEKMNNAEIVVNTAKKLDEISRKAKIQAYSYDEIIKIAGEKEPMLKNIPAIQPIENSDLSRTAAGWGVRMHPFYRIRKLHEGIDFTAPIGTEVFATADGEIEILEKSNRGHGNQIVINHGFGYKTLYAHLDGFNVKSGQKVKRGDVIGYVGKTGLSTATHLHYEVHLNGEKVNPVNYFFNELSPEEFDKMVELAMRPGQSFD